MALAVVLLVGAGLLIRSYQRISGVAPGFLPDHVLTFRVALPASKYSNEPASIAFVDSYTQRLARNGVSAAAVFGLPLDDDFSAASSFTRAGEVDTDESPSVGMRVASPDYFKVMNIPLRRGRVFDAHDTDTSPEVVIINEEAARRYWPDRDPIGQQLHLGARLTSPQTRSGMKTIVGIVGDVKADKLDAADAPMFYRPVSQQSGLAFSILARTRVEMAPAQLGQDITRAVQSVDPNLPVFNVRTIDDILAKAEVQRRFAMLLLALFAGIALLLAAIGVYGVVSYAVGQRTREIGIRLALGARPAAILGLVLGQGVVLAVIGVAVGVMGSFFLTRLLRDLLFGVTTTDFVTFATAPVLLTIIALLATWWPARRASRVDPLVALRYE